MIQLKYKPNAAETIERLEALLERRSQDKILASFKTPTRTIREFCARHETGFSETYPEPAERIKFWDDLLKERSAIQDDSIPSAYPSEFDQGLYGGLLGGDVRFLCMAEDGQNSSGWISSMVPPLLDDWSGFDTLRFDESNIWYKRYLEQLRIMAAEAEGKFGISHLIAIDSLNFVFELVGATNTYLSMYESPEMVLKAVDLAFDLNLTVHSAFFDIVPLTAGGTCSWVIPWVPGRVICESVDPFHMTSVQDFERWGVEPIIRIFSEFDGGVVHLHGNGRHLLEAVCTLPGLKAIYLGDNKGWPKTVDILGELKQRAGDMPLTVNANYNEFVENLDRHHLCGGVFYNVYGTPNIDTANRCMEKVRDYRV